ncbi:hypothetical protein BC832DRAFT_420953 [Gaertneriomyces semiglobifer]|nr:hypothetical protein BC832DRAFT_420953 [Gaertneriomyces semiglobifer]
MLGTAMDYTSNPEIKEILAQTMRQHSHLQQAVSETGLSEESGGSSQSLSSSSTSTTYRDMTDLAMEREMEEMFARMGRGELGQPLQTTRNGSPGKGPRGICRFWHKGTCRYGDACWFIHKGPPGQAPTQANAHPLLNGTGQYQAQHQRSRSSPTPHTSPLRPGSSGPRSICRYWLQGICNRGPACRFLHGSAAPCAMGPNQETIDFLNFQRDQLREHQRREREALMAFTANAMAMNMKLDYGYDTEGTNHSQIRQRPRPRSLSFIPQYAEASASPSVSTAAAAEEMADLMLPRHLMFQRERNFTHPSAAAFPLSGQQDQMQQQIPAMLGPEYAGLDLHTRLNAYEYYGNQQQRALAHSQLRSSPGPNPSISAMVGVSVGTSVARSSTPALAPPSPTHSPTFSADPTAEGLTLPFDIDACDDFAGVDMPTDIAKMWALQKPDFQLSSAAASLTSGGSARNAQRFAI